MRAVILAAGKGTRINTGSITVPKPLYAVGRKALIEHVILNLKSAGILNFVVIVGFMSEHIIDYLKDGSELGVHITYVYNPDFHRELGVSALAARKVITDENFILTMADHVIDPEIIKGLIKRMDATDKCILCVDKKIDHVNDIDSATKVLEVDNFINNLGWSIKEYNCIDCGLFGLTPKIFNAQEKAQNLGRYTLSDGVLELVSDKEFIVMDIEDKIWTGVNTRSDLIICEELIEKMGWRRDGK